MERTGTYTVVEQCNDHGSVTLREHPRNGTIHVVEYDDAEIGEALADLAAGTVVDLDLRRAGRRGNAWRVEGARGLQLKGHRLEPTTD